MADEGWLTVGQIAAMHDLDSVHVTQILHDYGVMYPGKIRHRALVDSLSGRATPTYHADDVAEALLTAGVRQLGGPRG